MSDNISKFINANNLLDKEYIKSIATEHTPPKRNSRGIDFNAFSNSLGSKKFANISTPLGHITIDVHSQFKKMQYAKENRRKILFNIKHTLKNPMLISVADNGAFIFYSAYKQKDGNLFHTMSICDVVDDKIVLKTSYEPSTIGKIQKLLNSGKTLLYDKSNPELNKSLKDTIKMVKGEQIVPTDDETKEYVKSFKERSEDMLAFTVSIKEVIDLISEYPIDEKTDSNLNEVQSVPNVQELKPSSTDNNISM
jgi:hypothetical protein